MRSIRRNKAPRVDEENPYWISFSDLMSALLVVFILAAVALIIELTQTQQKITEDIDELRNAERARLEILLEVKEELKTLGIDVMIADNKTVIRIPDETLAFRSDHHEIPGDEVVRKSVDSIGEVLHRAINKPLNVKGDGKKRSDYLDTVFVEGHTDSWRTKRYEGGNWELSTRRAVSIWDSWRNNLEVTPPFTELINSSGAKLFSVSGYAATRRANEVEQTREDRRENRRIDIRFTVKRPSITQLQDIIDR